ncbi:MAG TPA: SDR family NAD(P)-dependent oxidoreductase, partial [Chitinophagaceae bacterium]|nr:SDR family NAD(P)-dependent oxidoreductase [Chitinophagaceae bacterium]
FAIQLAKAGVNVILSARSVEKLETLAATITQHYGVAVWVFAENLAIAGSAEQLYNAIKKQGLKIDLLVNNAGFGRWTNFLDEQISTYEEMIELNIISLTTLTQLVIPDMLSKKEGGIINVASTGAFQPCPYVTTYCATKAYVLSFSEGIYGEFYKKGITITALCPGNTTTGFQSIAKANTKGMRADKAETVAKQGIQAMLKGKSYTVVGTDNYITSLSPRFLTRKAIIHLVARMMGNKVNW